MRRYRLAESKEFKIGDILDLEKELFHHIFIVCRTQVGEKFELLNAENKAAIVETLLTEKKKAKVKILDVRFLEEIKKPFINLCLSFPKIPTFESILEKSVEIGVKTIQPFVSDFSFFKDVKKVPYEQKIDRWDKIIESASNQCGRGELLKLQKVVTLEELLLSFNPNPKQFGLFAYEGKTTQDATDYLKTQFKKDEIEEIWVFIGSEGGFSLREVDLIAKKIIPVSFGNQILRVETACMLILGILKYEAGLL